jgi:benzil reductase ((S)-benzoin forming)
MLRVAGSTPVTSTSSKSPILVTYTSLNFTFYFWSLRFIWFLDIVSGFGYCSFMKPNLHIITGGSRGLGLGMATYFVERGDTVVSIQRTKDSAFQKIQTFSIDLSQRFSAQELFNSIFTNISLSDFYQISLINNAGMIEPISPTSRISESFAERNIALNLTAPILLTSEFLKQTEKHNGKRIVFNVSSGVARNPKQNWAVYSAAKAGLEAFSVAVQKELGEASQSKVITFDPGIMDTTMQAEIRNSSEEDFPELKRFIAFKENGDLLDPQRVGKIAAQVILGEIAGEQTYVSIGELLSAGH